MQIETSIILGILGGAVTIGLTAITRLFFLLLAAKEAQIAELKETIKYQRGVTGIATETTHRAVDYLERRV